MRYLFIAFLFISSFISGQGIEPTSLQPTQYQGGILRGVIPYVDEFTGETLYIYQHVDSLVFVKDSIYVRNDSIFLRDGTGFAVVTDSIYVVTGVSKDTIKLRDGNGYALVDKALVNGVRGTGTATRVAWWGSTDSLSSDANLYWDNSNKYLGINTATPTAPLDVVKNSFALPVARFENSGTNGRTVTVSHGASTEGRYTMVLENGASANTYFDTRGYLGLGITPSYPLHVYGTNGISRFQNTNSNGDAGFDFVNPTNYWRFAMNAEGGTTNNVHFRDVTNSRYPLTLQQSNGFVGINKIDPSYQLHVVGNTYISEKLYVSDKTGTAGAIGGWANDLQAVIVPLGSGLSLSSGTLNTASNVVKGTGVATRVAFWGTSDTLSSSSNLYWDNSNNYLGVNTSSPTAPLDVTKNSYALPVAYFSNTGTNGMTVKIRHEANTEQRYPLILENGSNNTTYFDTRGYLGLGISPAYPLHVQNTTGISRFQNTNSNGDAGFDFVNGNKYWRFAMNAEGGTTNNFHIRDVTGGRYPFTIDASTGFVGINTINSILKQLHVNGEIRITDLNNDPATKLLGADNDGDVSSVSVGNGLTIDAGTLTVTANISGTQNRVAKFTSQYGVGNSEIYTIGDTLVGINQSNPQYHLDVTGKFRVTNRTGTAVTGAGFTTDGQLISYNLDTALATPNTYIQAGSNISVTGGGTMADPYTINNSAPENTTVKDGTHLDFSELSNDTITASIIASSIGPTELQSTSVSAGTYQRASITVDADGRITSASNNTDSLGITSITTVSPITGGTITSTGAIGISDASANGTTKGAATYTAADFNDNGGGLISIDYTNGQAASGSTKGFLTSTDWTTFNNKVSTVTASSPLSSSGGTSPNISMTQSGGASNGWLSSANWNTFNNKMDAWGIRVPSGTGGNVIQYLTSYSVLDFYNGSGITISRPSGILGITITATDASTTNELQNLSYGSKTGTDIPLDIASGVGVYFREGTGISLARTASNVMTINSTVTNTDNQTLSFSSPNLSISGGNSVALPVLPTGTASSNTLRWSGSVWSETSMLKTTTARVDINSWPGTVNLGSKLLVNGHIQYTNTGFQASTITGRDTDGGLTGVTLGNTVRMDAGTLNTDPRYALMYNATGFTASGTGTVNYITNDINNGITVSTGSDYLQSIISGVYEVCIEVNADLTADEYLYLTTNLSGFSPEIRLETGSNQVRGTYRSCAIKALSTDTVYTYYDSNGANVSRISISMNKVN